MTRFTTLLFAALLLAATSSTAQVREGDVELEISGSLRWSEAEQEVTSGMPFRNRSQLRTFGAATRVGYFVSPRFDIGGLTRVSFFDGEGGSDSYSVRVGPSFNYHFRPESNVVPSLGLAAGLEYVKQDFSDEFFRNERTTDGWFVEARGGADFFVSKDVAVKLQLCYVRTELDREIESSDPFAGVVRSEVATEEDEITTSIGLAFFLGRD